MATESEHLVGKVAAFACAVAHGDVAGRCTSKLMGQCKVHACESILRNGPGTKQQQSLAGLKLTFATAPATTGSNTTPFTGRFGNWQVGTADRQIAER